MALVKEQTGQRAMMTKMGPNVDPLLDEADRAAFLADLGLEETGLTQDRRRGPCCPAEREPLADPAQIHRREQLDLAAHGIG